MTTTPQLTRGRKTARTVAYVLCGVVALLIVTLAVAVSVGGKASSRPGDQAVYDGINSATDCGSLATLFEAHRSAHDVAIGRGDTDLAATETAYMDAVHDRQQQLNCP